VAPCMICNINHILHCSTRKTIFASWKSSRQEHILQKEMHQPANVTPRP
jgi:hypothetical protein